MQTVTLRNWLHRCKTLDASADGYVRAEAVGCAILMPAAAVPEGMLPGLVLLSGSAVNQDGRSSSLTAPNGPSQQGVIRQALQAGGVLGAEVAVVQMHGTGTPLGGKPFPPTPPSPLPPPSPPTFTSQSCLLLRTVCPLSCIIIPCVKAVVVVLISMLFSSRQVR